MKRSRVGKSETDTPPEIETPGGTPVTDNTPEDTPEEIETLRAASGSAVDIEQTYNILPELRPRELPRPPHPPPPPPYGLESASPAELLSSSSYPPRLAKFPFSRDPTPSPTPSPFPFPLPEDVCLELRPSTGDQTTQPPQTPLPADEERMKKMRAALLAKRKARYRFARRSFGNANVNEFGCIKGIRIKEDKINTILVEKHDPQSQEEFLKEVGAIMDTDIRPPLQLPTAEQIKEFEANMAKMIDKAIESRQKIRDRSFAAGIPIEYCPTSSFKQFPRSYDIIEKCALLATKDYSTQTLTKYRFLDVEKLGWKLKFGIQYYIIFQAMSSEGSDTFEAEVVYRRIGKKNLLFGSISVLSVRIRRPGSDWHKGLLKELIN